MPQTNLLKKYGLSRNPFTDRTAEKTELDTTSLYILSDLQHFKPSEETYLFFGKRGSGKTTIRLTMQRAYERVNENLAAEGKPQFFVVDLCKPGHMTACLKDFQEIMNCSRDNWDATFVESWALADLVDCIYSYAITHIVDMLTAEDEAGKKLAVELATRLRSNGKVARRFVLLASLYARTDHATLRKLRNTLHPWTWLPESFPVNTALATVTAISVGAILAHTALKAVSMPSSSGSSSSPIGEVITWRDMHSHSVYKMLGGAASICGMVGLYTNSRCKASKSRASKMQEGIHVVKRRPVADVAAIIDLLVKGNDSVETIRQIQIGNSAHQKLEKLQEIVRVLGYDSLCVFGDCFDEVTFLDPVLFPGAIKQFAKEVCRNDLLNFGRMHFFFPDSRINLDLTTDKTLKDARFDRHFVRDMTWSRHQLEELAERRFQAAQEKYGITSDGSADSFKPGTPFGELFKEVNGDDFAGYVSKLETPRELLIMMTEMFSRIEQNPGGKLKAQDMEFAVNQAKLQSV